MNLNKPKLKIIISISIQSSNLIDFNYITKAQKQMLRPTSYGSFMQQKPRKKLKLDTVNEKVYNEFEGNSDVEQNNHQTKDNYEGYEKDVNVKQLRVQEEIQGNEKIYLMISRENKKFRKVGDQAREKNNVKKEDKSSKDKKDSKNLKKEQANTNIKLEQGSEQMKAKIQQQKSQSKPQAESQKPAPKTKQPQPLPSSNWKAFLQQSTTKNANSPTSIPSQFVAMDCEFVKCGQVESLARISLVGQNGQTLYDSYIKPAQKVTDFLTEITGITFGHIKNAPLWDQQVKKVKKILLGKILVGHTLHKDLQVTGLSEWKGVSKKIDIAEFLGYKEKNGSKIVGLKKLSMSFLNRNIQSGWHSSVQDALATMDLFKINKKKILKQFKLI